MLQTKRSWKGPAVASLAGAIAGTAIFGAVYLQYPFPGSRLPEDIAIKNKLSMAIVTRAKLSYEKLLLLNAETAALNSGAGRAVVRSEGNNPVDPEVLDAGIAELNRAIASLRVQQQTAPRTESFSALDLLFLTDMFAIAALSGALIGFFGYDFFSPAAAESDTPFKSKT